VNQLPADHALEQQIIGAAIADRNTAEAYSLDHKITDSAFTTDHHITLWRVIQHRLDHAKGPLDPTTLNDVLQRNPGLIEGHHDREQIMATVSQIAQTTNGAGNAEHADRLLDLAERRRIITTCQATIRLATQPDQRPADILVTHDQQIAAATSGDGRPTRTLASIIEETIPAWEHPENNTGMATTFVDLDQTLKGLHPGNLCVIAARPAMGKTAIVTDIAAAGGKQGTVLFGSLEMTDAEIAARYVAAESSTPGHWLTRGEGRRGHEQAIWARIMDVADTDAAKRIHVMVRRGLKITDFIRIARRTHAREPLSLVIVDYLQLLVPVDPKMPRHLQVAEMANSLKSLAFELECPVIALSQLNRDCESRTDKRPVMSDIKESGDIEQTADQVLLLYRDEYYDPDTKDPGVVEVNVAKNRHGGTGVVRLTFEGRYPRFRNRAKAHQIAQAPAPNGVPYPDLPVPNAS
jgi:replicative DNA helicase